MIEYQCNAVETVVKAVVSWPPSVVTIPSEGVYLWKVAAEEMRDPSTDQVATFKSSAFTNWYALKKAAADIIRKTGTNTATQ